MTGTTEAAAPPRPAAWVLVPFLVGAAVAVALGVYSERHDPTGEQVVHLFFEGTLQMKVWLATLAFALAVFQLLSGMRMYGTFPLPRRVPGWYGDAHRLSGTVAFVVSLPVGYHCLWALGFADTDSRVLLHSLFGCVFYGAFVTKVLAVRDHRLPGWTLPLVGSVVFTSLVLLFLTSSVWFFTDRPSGIPIL
jgi:hypothetical protein